ncbi:TetR/AcrR family transcriptional regulator [Sphingomonas sp. 28-63-12]|uniref:TetR/AcrR family transcriptional regulator n=1 Tax=Sphingomonas sp. 28-63-12 TaxID=1970434 RepID=UPI000BDC1D50|nr:MAG: hypothetical protein B7Y47_11105 [Sphingomonas sp. 28-63-12]
MGRAIGAVGKNHAAKRLELLARLTTRLTEAEAMHASYRELAASAGVSLSTLQHYFGKRDDIVAAVLQQAHQDAAPYIAALATPQATLDATVHLALAQLNLGFTAFGVGAIHALALVEGLRNAVIGPVTVDAVLEPSIAALATSLAGHQQRGEMRPDIAPRHAAIMLIAPPLLLLLHQHELGGARDHPVEIDAFLTAHASTFLRAHAATPATSGD